MKYLGNPQSGSRGEQTASRNSYGQYLRNRATPVNPNSSAQAAVRARMSANAAAWRALDDEQRAGWKSLGLQMVRTDALGQSYNLTGFAAFCSVNNILLEMGSAQIEDAPIYSTPDALTSATLTATSAALSLAYTVTPLPAGAKLLVFASPQRSAGRTFEGDLRLVHTSAAAAASPANILSGYTAKFGAPVAGNRIFVSGVVAYAGFLSGPTMVTEVVTAA